MHTEEIIQVDAEYEGCAKSLGLSVSADEDLTVFEGKSQTGRYELSIYIPHKISSRESSSLIRYKPEKDVKRLEDQVIGLQTLITVRDRLKRDHNQTWTSSGFDECAVNLDYSVQLRSYKKVVPYIQAISSCFPKHL